MGLGNTASLGTLIVSLQADGTQFMRTFNQVDTTTKQSVDKIVSGFKIAGAAAAAAVAGIATASVKSYADFDQSMVKALSIMDASDRAYRAQMEETARAVGRTTTTSAQDAAKAYYFLAAAGLDAQQSMAALPKVVEFATASDLDAARATELLADSMGAMGLASKDATKYAENMQRMSDELAMAGNRTTASQEQFAAALRTKSAAAARIMGKSLEETVASLMAYATAGIKAENAGEQLSQMWRDSQTAFVENKAVWDQIGISVYDAGGKMKNTADFIGTMEKALAGMSDEQRKTTLGLLGFQDRSINAMMSLMGMSGQIRQFQKDLESANGATKEIADVQMTSFNAQVKVLWNNLQDLLLEIGKELLPVIRMAIEWINTLKDAHGNWGTEVKNVAYFITAVLLTAVGAAMDAWRGWVLIIKLGQLGTIAFMEAIRGAYNGLVALGSSLQFVNNLKNGIFSPELLISAKDSWNEMSSIWKGLKDGSLGSIKSQLAEINDLIDKGRPSDEIMAAWERMQARIAAAQAAAEKLARAAGGKKDAPKGTGGGGGTTDGSVMSAQSIEALSNSYVAGWHKQQEILGYMVNDLAEGKITMEQFNRAVEQMNLEGEFVDPLESAFRTIRKIQDAAKYGILPKSTADRLSNNALSQANPFMNNPEWGQGVVASNMNSPLSGVSSAAQFNAQENAMKSSYDRMLAQTREHYAMLDREATGDKERQLALEQEKENALLQMQQNYSNMTRQYNLARTQTFMSDMSGVMDNLLMATKTFAGEHSGIYKAMFIATKAFAVAQILVQTEVAAWNAMAMYPAPANMIMATVIRVAGYAAAAATMAQAIMSFDGGGLTPNGPRSGGLDGKGGRLAIMHPNERVIDLTKDEDIHPAGGAMTVNVHNYAGADVQVQRNEESRQIDVIVRRVKQEVASEIRTGGNHISNALQDTYNVRRGQR